MKHHHLSPSWKKWGRSSQTATNNKKNAPPLPRDRQLLVNFHQKGCDWSALERLTGNWLLEWHLHDVTSSPSVTWASFPSRFLIGPFEWVSLVSIQVFEWSVWMGQPRFHPGFGLVRLNGSALFPSRFLIGPFEWVTWHFGEPLLRHINSFAVIGPFEKSCSVIGSLS